MAALFACTRCTTRHPFEELSVGDQLCKKCRNEYPVIKCTYCRIEYQQDDKNSHSSICRKCYQNMKAHGKPKACEFCNIIAAFIGNKCQRCAYSEKKWGLPVVCQQCKLQCAFDRSEESRKKVGTVRVDGKILCYLCTMAYKRVLAKTMHHGASQLSSSDLSSRSQSKSEKKSEQRNHHRSNSGRGGSRTDAKKRDFNRSSGGGHDWIKDHTSERDRRNGSREPSDKGNEKSSEKNAEKNPDKNNSSRPQSQQEKAKSENPKAESKNKEDSNNSDSGPSSAKKPRIDKAASNGVSTPSKMSSDTSSLLGSTDNNIIALTQLKEEVEALKKQMAEKDKIILDRDRKITALKAEHFESEKEMRNRIASMTKNHNEAMDTFLTKNRDLQKQISALSKNSGKKTVSPPT